MTHIWAMFNFQLSTSHQYHYFISEAPHAHQEENRGNQRFYSHLRVSHTYCARISCACGCTIERMLIFQVLLTPRSSCGGPKAVYCLAISCILLRGSLSEPREGNTVFKMITLSILPGSMRLHVSITFP